MHNACKDGMEDSMPALQVRDMPPDLYDRIKVVAKRNRRSIAQETIELLSVALNRGEEQMESGNPSGYSSQSVDVSSLLSREKLFPSEAALSERKRARKALFDWIEENPLPNPPGFDDSAAFVRECRNERERELDDRA